MINYKYVLYIIMINLFFLIFVFLLSPKNNDINYLNDEEYTIKKNDIIVSNKKNKYIISTITINNSTCFYDEKSSSYLFPVREFTKLKTNIKIVSPNKVNTIVQSKTSVIDLKTNQSIELLIYDSKYYSIVNINFTTLPIINITTNFRIEDIKKISQTYKDDQVLKNIYSKKNNSSAPTSLFNISYPNKAKLNGYNRNIYSLSLINYHGHDSLRYEKKSYSVDLIKKINNNIVKNDISLLDMYKDNAWVLDAMYADKSKIRNKLSSDIWRTISNKNVLNSKYVEVFIDNQYNGLYTLKEKNNKKSLLVTESGSTLKSILYINEYDKNIKVINNKIYSLKYKSNKYDSSGKLIDNLTDYYSTLSNLENTDNIINKIFDVENLIKYKCLLAVIKGTDNEEYNNYYYYMQSINSKILKVPWDMDLTFGLTFNNQNDYEQYNEMGFEIYYPNSPKMNKKINEEYKLIRKIINENTLNNFIETYKDSIINSGASLRDSKRWYYYNPEEELENIKKWYINRFNYLDDFFMINP